ncbi:lasso peptide [bacterium]|nr:lasso peptide [bacterium]
MKSIVKKQYVAPQLTVYGDVKKITQGNSTGSKLDQTFRAGTAFGDLTFS